ncbi:MAG: hypothetical protein COB02_15840 [Candidatus Cloacimonadota bacterium]|nr:MAG: hypothetical protein COB02_15840 [Candidatus Cloacimonadota bacterium]
MNKVLLTSLFCTTLITSSIQGASNRFEDNNNFPSFQQKTPSRSLKLSQIKAKLNRLKRNKASKYKIQNNDNFSPRIQNFQKKQSPKPSNHSQQSFQEEKQSRFSSKHSRRNFSNRQQSQNPKYDISLVKSCESAGNDLTLRGQQGEKARKFYSNRCDQFISNISVQYKLDNLLDLQGKFLSLKGHHKEANKYITLAYQQAPNSLNTNIALIKNLASLGQRNMAEEMLLFYIDDKGVQNLNPREHQNLKRLHQKIRQMQ